MVLFMLFAYDISDKIKVKDTYLVYNLDKCYIQTSDHDKFKNVIIKLDPYFEYNISYPKTIPKSNLICLDLLRPQHIIIKKLIKNCKRFYFIGNKVIKHNYINITPLFKLDYKFLNEIKEYSDTVFANNIICNYNANHIDSWTIDFSNTVIFLKDIE